ncbi:MAG TPA: AAA family ATPase [Terriglobia bacterium]|nr:AAA family ATPase [Terriglobia bacterium]
MNFESFLGNADAAAAVREMLASGHVPGALLFTGPDGVGKKTLAEMLAKALNCERPSGDGSFCGECAPCRKVDEMLAASRDDLARRRELKDAGKRVEGLVYFDVQLIEPITRYILTEQIRELRRVAYAHPFELRRRVFIIDQAQAIHWQAVDLLLKVLEEPPDSTTLVLVCPNAYELRPTIRSRCRRVQFVPVPDSLISELLACEARVPPAQRTIVARLAAGSVSKALTFDLAAYLERRQPWLDFLESVSAQPGSPANWNALFDAVKSLTAKRDEFEATLGIGYDLLQDLVQALESAEPRVSDPELLPRLKGWAGRLRLTGISTLKNGLDEAYRLQIRNVNQQLGFEALAVELAGQSG